MMTMLMYVVLAHTTRIPPKSTPADEPLSLPKIELRSDEGWAKLDAARELVRLAAAALQRGEVVQAESGLLKALPLLEDEQLRAARADAVNLLGWVYLTTGRVDRAERAFTDAMNLYRGADHEDYFRAMNNLGGLYLRTGKIKQAEPLLLGSLEFCRKRFGDDHMETASALGNVGLLHLINGEPEKAEPFLRESAAVFEKTAGPKHPAFAASLEKLGHMHMLRGNAGEAEAEFRRALAIHEKCHTAVHPKTVRTLDLLATALRKCGKQADAQVIERQIASIRKPLK